MPVERGYLIRSMLGFSPCRMPVTRRVRPECIVGRPAPRAEERSVPLCWPTGDATMGPKRRGDRLGKGGPCRFLGCLGVVSLACCKTVILPCILARGPGRAGVSRSPRTWGQAPESNRISTTRRKVLCGLLGGRRQLVHRATIEAQERAQVTRS